MFTVSNTFSAFQDSQRIILHFLEHKIVATNLLLKVELKMFFFYINKILLYRSNIIFKIVKD